MISLNFLFKAVLKFTIEKLVKCIERFNKGEIDADTSSKIEKQILVDEFNDEEFLEFAIENFCEGQVLSQI